MPSNNPAPGFASHPNHTVEIRPTNAAINIVIDNEVIGKTSHSIVLEEKGYASAYYLPKSSLADGMLQASGHTTHCPFKGDASYYNLVHNGHTYKNAIWSYESPFDEALAIKDHIAIYPNVAKVELAEE